MCRGAIYFRAKDLPAGHFQPIKRIAVRGPVLAICARFKNHEAMKLLIEAGATVNSKAGSQPTRHRGAAVDWAVGCGVSTLSLDIDLIV